MAGNNPRFKRAPRLYETGAKVRNVIFLIYMEDLEAAGKCYGDIIAYLDSKHCKAVVEGYLLNARAVLVSAFIVYFSFISR